MNLMDWKDFVKDITEAIDRNTEALEKIEQQLDEIRYNIQK